VDCRLSGFTRRQLAYRTSVRPSRSAAARRVQLSTFQAGLAVVLRGGCATGVPRGSRPGRRGPLSVCATATTHTSLPAPCTSSGGWAASWPGPGVRARAAHGDALCGLPAGRARRGCGDGRRHPAEPLAGPSGTAGPRVASPEECSCASTVDRAQPRCPPTSR
jgi:hypothetical protein